MRGLSITLFVLVLAVGAVACTQLCKVPLVGGVIDCPSPSPTEVVP